MSKELEALKRIRQETCPCTYNLDFDKDECCNIIETALKEVSEEDRVFLKHIKKGKLHPLTTKCYQDLLKKQKALEIIKEKRVNCFLLIAIMRTSNRLEHYNQNYGKNWQLTQEEYDLLKEVLL